MKFDTTKIKIVFMGTPEFAVPSLAALIEDGYDIVAVVTNPDKPVGRKQTIQQTPIKQYAQEHRLKVLTPQKIEEIKKEFESIAPDLIIVSAYGKILPPWTLKIPPYGALNVHPSLLPRWRGASPIPSAILQGDKETGVTIMQMNERMDEGPILAQQELEIRNPNIEIRNKFKIQNSELTAGQLTTILAEIGANLLIETLPRWVKREIKPVPQNEKMATYSRILKKEDGHILWTKTAKEIERQIRAFNPWPGTFFYMRVEESEASKLLRLKILESAPWKSDFHGPVEVRLPRATLEVPGTVIKIEDGRIAVQTGSGLLVLDKVQLEGRKPMNVNEFIKGHPEFIGTILR